MPARREILMSKNKDYRALLRQMLAEWQWIMRYVRAYRFTVLLYILLGIIGTLMSLGTAVASKYLIDTVIQKNSSKLVEYASLTVGLAVFQFVFSAVSSWLSAVVGTKANNEIRQEIYSNILKSKWEEIHSFRSGDLLNRIEGDVSTVSNGVITFIPGVFTKLLQFAGAFAIVFYYDRIMAFLSLLSAPFLFFASRVLIKTMRKYNAKFREYNGMVLSFSEESIRNIQVIKAFDLTDRYIENFRGTLEAYRKVRLGYEKFSVITTFVLSVIGLTVSYLCYGWGVYRLWQGVITFGTMTLFLQISGSLSSSFSAIAGLVPVAISIATSAGRIMEVTEYEKESDPHKKETLELLKLSRGKGVSVNIKDVTFTYSDGEEPVLKNVSFSVNPGETIALTGTSGEGKTTLLKLLLGLVEPDCGELYLESGGKRVAISDSTRRACSYVPQEMSMFSGTIAENLRLVKADAGDDELREVLVRAEMWDYVSSLPSGINTVIGEMGENISAGQAQRISIARALLKNAPVLLMDEATSALDSGTEAKVLANIMKHDPEKVCILTTHRESMLQYCNRVYRVNPDGTVTQL